MSIVSIAIKTCINKIYTLFTASNLNYLGANTTLHYSTTIRYPKNIEIGSNTHVGKDVFMTAEESGSKLKIGKQVIIGKNVFIDFTGGLTIGDNVVISSNSTIYTHSHGYNPKSIPVKAPLIIEDDVWIGTGAIILESVERIGKKSIIAAGSVLTKSTKDNSIYGGSPAKLIKQIESQNH